MLGYGSGGTVVFAGELGGRPVAVKRMLRQFYGLARREIGALILADEHPNIVRCVWLGCRVAGRGGGRGGLGVCCRGVVLVAELLCTDCSCVAC